MEETESEGLSIIYEFESASKSSKVSPRRNSSEGLPSIKDRTIYLNHQDESSDDGNEGPCKRTKKRVQRFSDSDNESNSSKKSVQCDGIGAKSPTNHQDSDGNNTEIIKSVSQTSRIRKFSTSEGTDSEETSVPSKNNEQQIRIKNKTNKLRQKFKSLVTSRVKEKEPVSENQIDRELNSRHSESSDTSNDEASSIDKIRQKIKERTMHLKSTIYDPDTSDEETSPKEMQRSKKQRKSTKLTSPKPMRMSAKQAMENMQKIRSESNRMLREKEVTLPYHRPKALSLKDIMSRRRPAVTSDGKAMPIKMNDEQLRQYIISLEQRQKEIMELCKSDTDEETPENDEKQEEITANNDLVYDDLVKTNTIDTTADDANVEDLGKKQKYVEELLSTDKDMPATDISTSISNKGNLSNNANLKSSIENEDLPTNPNVNSNISSEMELVYNDSIDKDTVVTSSEKNNEIVSAIVAQMEYNDGNSEQNSTNVGINSVDDGTMVRATEKNAEIVVVAHVEYPVGNSEPDSQLISLNYNDSKKINEDTDKTDQSENNRHVEITQSATTSRKQDLVEIDEDNEKDDFSEDDINMEDIDALIENAEIIKSNTANGENFNSPMLVRDPVPLKTNPKLTGTPGMVIDLDGTDPFAPKKLTGVELLKERFIYFARLKTPEELERQRENRIKPGMQHYKLKQELEDEITEQRSLEWAKRLEAEKQHLIELNAIRGEESDAENDIDKIEAKLEENEVTIEKESSSDTEEEDEAEEDIGTVQEKPRKRNPMIADEAEESDCDDFEDVEQNNEDGNDGDVEGDENEDDDESSEESSDEEDEEDKNQSKQKKSRILKAFEDSDDENTAAKFEDQVSVVNNATTKDISKENGEKISMSIVDQNRSPVIKDTQDDELQLAQRDKSFSEDLFTSQEDGLVVQSSEQPKNKVDNSSTDDKELGTQTFSILNSAIAMRDNVEMEYHLPDKLTIVCNTQPYDDDNLDAVAEMCSGSFSQSLATSQFPTTLQSQPPFGEDILALCTGKFYDNQFVSQLDTENLNNKISQQTVNEVVLSTAEISQHESIHVSNDNRDSKVTQKGTVNDHDDQINTDLAQTDTLDRETSQKPTDVSVVSTEDKETNMKQKLEENNFLKSIFEELHDPEFEAPKQKKYFVGNDNQNKENKANIANGQLKKKFTIDSDDEVNEATQETGKREKKLKKRKLEQRALQISDDEDEEESDQEEVEENASEVEDVDERVVEYDSEENEVVAVQLQNPKKKRKMADFFEQEAELTSEDEWVGSGDEDEAGLDRMEREAGDDDTFNQGRLQRELEQIHMRDVLDQDKREVRIIQELLFEDGDLGAGHRQRRFRWKNADGEEETGTMPSEFADSQEEEFESEEQWRKQRHERETFLKQMQNQDKPAEEALSVSVNRSSMIKASLASKATSGLLSEITSGAEDPGSPAPEKKTSKDIPSPRKSFTMFQQNYHGSLLTRGSGALARLAALAGPLPGEDDNGPKAGSLGPSGKRNFVFATLTPDVDKPKVSKRKPDSNASTPRLVKKMKTVEKQMYPRNSLLDHMKA